MNKRHKILAVIAILAVGYFGSYAVFRQTNQEVWEKDNSVWVIFPENKILYYVYRPVALLDANLTGMKFHIGPHQ